MKARLNILGRKHNIISVEVQDPETGERKHIYDSEFYPYMPDEQKVDLAKNIETPLIVEERTKLIEHLDEMIEQESNELTIIAIDAMEGEPDLPFDSHLSIKQKEYKLKQQRVLGLIDGVEEVKAFTEGYFINDDSESIETQSSH